MTTYEVASLCIGNSDIPIILPFQSADPENSLERGVRPYSVPEILKEVFRADFRKSIQNYLKERPDGVLAAIGLNEANEIQLRWISEPKVESSLAQPICSMYVDLLIRTIVDVSIPVKGASLQGISVQVTETNRYTVTFRLRYMLNLIEHKCSSPIVVPEEFFVPDFITEQKADLANQYLLPVMYAEDYPKMARRMMELNYPEALERPTAVDGWKLAKRMGLKIRIVRFEKGSNIQGRIYFDWTRERIRDSHGKITEEIIPPNTILINRDNCPTVEIENATIIHECCHMFKDGRFFFLQMLGGKAYTSFTSRKKERKKAFLENSPIDWMELQAEKLPAYILMEEHNTRNEIDRLLRMRDGVRSPENMWWIMCRLADTFKVSRSMAKYRMIELGYPEAEGIYTYLDNVRIPDYGCGSTWKDGITYAISRTDAGALLRESEKFGDVLCRGHYIYLEGHFCLDMEPYVELNYRQQKRLTKYARHHIEECCLSFSVQGRYTDAAYEDALASKKTPVKDKYLSRHTFVAEPNSACRKKENKIFLDDSEIWMKMAFSMPDSMDKAVRYILDEKGLSQDDLAERLGVSRAAWRKWCSGKMSLRHITAVCIALDVRADIGLELVRLTGLSFQNNTEHKLMLQMLYDTRDLTVARANEIMIQANLKPLTEGGSTQEEVAC